LPQLRLDRTNHTGRDPILHVENISHRRIEPISPKMHAAPSFNELACDSHAIAGLPNTTL